MLSPLPNRKVTLPKAGSRADKSKILIFPVLELKKLEESNKDKIRISKVKKVTKKIKFIASSSSKESVDEKALCNDSPEGAEKHEEEV
ncbi:hypothetical protein ILUMI_23989 [Ignelater luminosus]|uniref:Uncharacterized protein n=1 Tax=Ignelater luminosus TaxID=2038154 RepID=A0A8K0C7V0_IGNLU|nr:hypothetical protein ILUMI_23989 [Ignelater luminosus]